MGKIFDALEKSKKDRRLKSEAKSRTTESPPDKTAKSSEPAPPKRRTTSKKVTGSVDFKNIHTSLANERTARPVKSKSKTADASSNRAPETAKNRSPRTSPDSDLHAGRPVVKKPDRAGGDTPKADTPPHPPKKTSSPSKTTTPAAAKPTAGATPESKKKETKIIAIKRETVPNDTDAQPDEGGLDHIQIKKKTPPVADDPRRIHQRLANSLLTFWKPQSLISEQFKKLRTNILFSTTDIRLRSILVTSATPDEGKSFVAANLAISIAHNINEHVLLIDCDLRNPSLHSLFGYETPPGLSEYLTNRRNIPSLMLKTQIDKLSLLPSGSSPSNPAELLSSEKMKHFLIEAKERYADRYIIIDTPPPLLTAETLAVAKQVDGILLVVNCGNTKQFVIEDTIERIGRDKILGVVLNRSTSTSQFLYGYAKKHPYYQKDDDRSKKRK